MSDNSSILEVALKAGVSTATVSRVLNRSGAVAPDTAKTVMRCVEALGYALPQRRSRMRSGRTVATYRKQIAIVGVGNAGIGWLEQPVIARAVLATTRAAQDAGYGVLLEDISDPSSVTGALCDGQVAGAVVWLSSALKPSVLTELAGHLPLIRAMGDQIEALGVDHVAPNNRQVGVLARRYLEQQGCREFLFVSAHPHWDVMRIRADGFYEAAEGSAEGGRSVLVTRDECDTFGRRPAQCVPDWNIAADVIASCTRRPVGVFAARDYEASQLYPLLAARGVRLGEDVLIVSCDNDPTRLSGLSPRPASIDPLSDEVGRRAFAQLLVRIERPAAPAVQILVAPRLHLSGSESAVQRLEQAHSALASSPRA